MDRDGHKKEIIEGLKRASAICLGYFPYGVAFGLLARQCGLSTTAVVLMATVVYAGSAQLLALGLLKAGHGLLSIMLATWIVNLRYFLMSSSLCSSTVGWSLRDRLFLSYYISDETFAVLSERAEEKTLTRAFALTVNMTAVFGWTASCVTGSLVGDLLPNLNRFGFDYALTAVFIALLVLLARDRWSVLTAVVAATAAIVLSLLHVEQFSVLISAATGAWVGTLAKTKKWS